MVVVLAVVVVVVVADVVVVAGVVVLGALYTGLGVAVLGLALGLVATLLAAEYEFCEPDGKESVSWELKLDVGKLTGFEVFGFS